MTALGRNDPAHAEAVAIAYVVDRVGGGGVGVATTDKVGVQRAGATCVAGVGGCDQRLPEDVATKKVAKTQVQALSYIRVGLDLFQFEQTQ